MIQKTLSIRDRRGHQAKCEWRDHSPDSAVDESEIMIFSITYCEKSVLSIKARDKNGKMSPVGRISSVNV